MRGLTAALLGGVAIGLIVTGIALADPERVVIPTAAYGSGAGPAAVGGGDNALLVAIGQAVARIEQRLVAIEQRLAGGAPAVAPQPAPTPAPAEDVTQARLKRGAQVLARSCVSCHIAGKAETDGGSFVIVEDNGKLALLSGGARAGIKQRVEDGTMPPKKDKAGQPIAPLTDAEKSDLIFVVTPVQPLQKEPTP